MNTGTKRGKHILLGILLPLALVFALYRIPRRVDMVLPAVAISAQDGFEQTSLRMVGSWRYTNLERSEMIFTGSLSTPILPRTELDSTSLSPVHIRFYEPGDEVGVAIPYYVTDWGTGYIRIYGPMVLNVDRTFSAFYCNLDDNLDLTAIQKYFFAPATTYEDVQNVLDELGIDIALQP